MAKRLHLIGLVAALSAAVASPAPAAGAPRMSLEEKVGQLFVTYAYGATADTTDPAHVAANRKELGVDNAKQLIEKYHLGGVIYFSWAGNTANPAQTAGLSNGLQAASRLPLLISTDQEHGVVYRVGEPATQFPGSMALGASRSPVLARDAGLIAGRELRAMGINQNYAPDADVNVNPLNPVIGARSFAEDPTLAARLTAAQVEGYQQGGVVATAKHFPGHGDTNVDSHTGIPVINHSREQWERLDAPPFRAAIDSGIDSIMTGHLVVPALDPSRDPATLSKPIITGLLREKLGFQGVVVTDSLGMAGVRQKYGDARVPVLALKAGVDQLLKPPNIDLAYNAVLKAVRDGELTEARIDESVRRILDLKRKRGLYANRFVDPNPVVGVPASLRVAQEVADRGTTVLRNSVLPLPDKPGKVLVTGWGTTAEPAPAKLARSLAGRGAATTVLPTGAKPTQAQIEAAVAAATELNVVITNNASAEQQRLVKALQGTGKRVVVIGVREPYEAASLLGTYVATYSYARPALESAVRVIYGEVSPSGKLPVTVPGHFPFGHGLTWRI
ncbi:glycoside hydrolase family 3 protein [Allokutzneria sp. A3M-2-11 16]|uniref:glycoside hydrolase family 3 protein n=1 Tax=Allokutzneria sp. A3M-2-11 16 TaxID=2962043 RepID=UPI0020B63803|nr:glycoside hydrolase family 3 protein [Allokutzneria sp. A3M-2-11 16]MCP3799479.1 glycoside hydrolase family 3 protein [Allokutzneria sp. A3M-2-11 16]